MNLVPGLLTLQSVNKLALQFYATTLGKHVTCLETILPKTLCYRNWAGESLPELRCKHGRRSATTKHDPVSIYRHPHTCQKDHHHEIYLSTPDGSTCAVSVHYKWSVETGALWGGETECGHHGKCSGIRHGQPDRWRHWAGPYKRPCDACETFVENDK